MRISDWSSDVCSSDLLGLGVVALIDDAEAEGTEVAALMRSVIDQFENYAKLNRKLPAETAVQLSEIVNAARRSSKAGDGDIEETNGASSADPGDAGGVRAARARRRQERKRGV